jgi:hypothetical protein
MDSLQLLLAALVPLECALLFAGQRRLFWDAEETVGRPLALLLALPGTVLHEAAHYLACLLLGVPAGRRAGARVELFRPRNTEQGLILGQVPHAACDPLRSALIAIAPLLLVPPLLIGASMLILGTPNPADLPAAITGAPLWKVALWAYIALSAGQAAFPSPGDRVGFAGAACLLALAAALISWVVRSHGTDALIVVAADIGAMLAVPAAAAAVCLGAFALLRTRRARKRVREA